MMNTSDDQDTKLIPLMGQYGKVRGYAIVDAEDFERVNAFNWHMSKKGYARRNVWLDGKYGKCTTIFMHNFILGIDISKRDRLVDHIDQDKLNNRKSNFRIVTDSESQQNRSKYEGEYTSPYVGVYWKKEYGKWAAQINVNKRRLHLGYFMTIEEAYRARLSAEEQYFTHAPVRGGK